MKRTLISKVLAVAAGVLLIAVITTVRRAEAFWSFRNMGDWIVGCDIAKPCLGYWSTLGVEYFGTCEWTSYTMFSGIPCGCVVTIDFLGYLYMIGELPEQYHGWHPGLPFPSISLPAGIEYPEVTCSMVQVIS